MKSILYKYNMNQYAGENLSGHTIPFLQLIYATGAQDKRLKPLLKMAFGTWTR